MNRVNWFQSILGAVVALICSGCTHVVCPKWQVTVLNEKYEPLAGCDVRQDWSYWSGLSSVDDQTNAVTDANGQVTFPKRKLRAPFGRTLEGALIWPIAAHVSYGPEATISVWKPGYDSFSVSRDSKPPVSNGVFLSTVVLKSKERPAALTEAVRAGNLELLKAELRKNPYYAKNFQGVKLLNDVIRSPNASGSNAVEMVKAVLDYLGRPDVAGRRYGPKPYVDFSDEDNITVLCRAILLRKFEVADYLLSIGVSPNPDGPWQRPLVPSALHLAVKSGEMKLVKALLARNADCNAKDADGKTPLDWAKQGGNQEIIELVKLVK